MERREPYLPSWSLLTFSGGQTDNKENKVKYIICHVAICDIEKSKQEREITFFWRGIGWEQGKSSLKRYMCVKTGRSHRGI